MWLFVSPARCVLKSSFALFSSHGWSAGLTSSCPDASRRGDLVAPLQCLLLLLVSGGGAAEGVH